MTEYFSNRKEGPKPNKTAGVHEEGADEWTSSRKSLSRPVRSFLAYHCGKSEFRPSCKIAFQLWGDALRATQLQLMNKRLRAEQAAAQAEAKASREAAQRRARGKRKAMKDKKNKKGKGKSST